MKTITIHDGRRQRIIGVLDNKKNRFVKTVNSSRHLFRKFQAYGIDAEFFIKELLPSNTTIYILETDTGKKFKSQATQWSLKNLFFHFNDDVENKAQIFFPVAEMEEIKDPKLTTEEKTRLLLSL
jgi:hypothetical protein